MAGQPPNRWYPPPMGNPKLDDALRIIYDNFYSLPQADPATPVTAHGGMSVTVYFAGGFRAGSTSSGPTYHRMTFQDGRLVGIS